MFYRLNEINLVAVLESLINPRIPAQYTRTNIDTNEFKKYLVIDMTDWAYYISRSSYTSSIIDGTKRFAELYCKYESFIKLFYNDDYLNLKNNPDNMTIIENVLGDNADIKALKEIYEMYNIFCKNIEQVQLMFLEEYEYNNAYIPVMVIPYSQSLARIDRDLLYITESEDPNYYKVIRLSVSDNCKKLVKEVNRDISFYYYYDDRSNIINSTNGYPNVKTYDQFHLSKNWSDLIHKRNGIKPEFKSYPERIGAMKELALQYAFTGFKDFSIQVTPDSQRLNVIDSKYGINPILINYPFALTKPITKTENYKYFYVKKTEILSL